GEPAGEELSVRDSYFFTGALAVLPAAGATVVEVLLVLWCAFVLFLTLLLLEAGLLVTVEVLEELVLVVVLLVAGAVALGAWRAILENTMQPRQITHQNIFRVLIVGFGLVILLLLAAAVVGVRNIQLIQENAASLVHDQGLTNRLIGELHSQQTSLSEVFSV